MNVDHSTSLDWRAIAAGAGASIAIGMSASFLMRPLFTSGGVDLAYGTLLAINALVSMLADAIGGATAGLLAKRRAAAPCMAYWRWCWRVRSAWSFPW